MNYLYYLELINRHISIKMTLMTPLTIACWFFRTKLSEDRENNIITAVGQADDHDKNEGFDNHLLY